LRNTLPAKRLAALECLSPDTSERVEDGREEQEQRRCDQTSRPGYNAQPLHNAHDQVDGGAHVIGLESADESIEFRGGRADAEEERYLNEQDDGKVRSGSG
jgi:hypothetical protein